ncbi:carbohydrate ABC transporter permease [Caldicoprobacter algeriensis]|uniref:carbohydrate ABC transporter permease n=1 Tax=Caldicoprobacter algeriensis TaxID=699281 RepID=UPI00207ABAA9|nr:carbohydrate ABC transporter permease [Caldicoprobacter algeriensis]MCM8900695.1 carbohydrate ABC transporter permease [Caldicoprobacter algeriensis]
MAKDNLFSSGITRFNRISTPVNILFSLIFISLALIAVIPVIFVIIISFSSAESIQRIGYSFFPQEWSIDAYVYLWNLRDVIGRSFLVSVGITIVGTVIGLFLNSTMGYVLSRKNFVLRNFFTKLIFIPMLFSGGLVSSYLINTQVLKLGNTYWALILPMAVSSFYIIVLRTFFQTTVPDSLIESAKIDGASQFTIYFKIVVPISLPALATIGLFLSFAYWNSWFLAMLYIQSTHQHMYPLQYVLMSIERNLQFLTQNSQFMIPEEALRRLPAESVRMAIVVIVVVPITLAYPFFQKYFISGLTIGAIKG